MFRRCAICHKRYVLRLLRTGDGEPIGHWACAERHIDGVLHAVADMEQTPVAEGAVASA